MKTVTTLLEVAGVALVVAGVAMLSVPAAFIVAGSGAVVVSWRLTGGDDS